MKEISKQFVPYELAAKLKAIGFKYTQLCYRDGVHTVLVENPTFSQAFSWFRENHRMFHEVFIDTEPTIENPNKLEFAYLILHMVGKEHMYTDKTKGKRFDTYEEAELACLNRMLEAVETNEK